MNKRLANGFANEVHIRYSVLASSANVSECIRLKTPY